MFHDLLKRVPRDRFAELVCEHGSDKHVRRLRTKDQFIALLYGQFSGASSLREIVGGLESHGARLYHVGGRSAQRSTLADANAGRPRAVFTELFAAMVGQARRGLRRAVGEVSYLIDSTGPRLNAKSAEWARFSAVALIAYLLMRLAKADQKAVKSPLAFARLVRANLMHRKRIDQLLAPDPTPPKNPNQLVLQW